IASKMVTTEMYGYNRTAVYPAAEVEQRSNQICELVAAASLRSGAEFVDVRGEIRSIARKQLIHGPRDWGHFNQQGYVGLGKILSAYLENQDKAQVGCAQLKTTE